MQRLYDKLHDFAIPPHSDPIAAIHDLEDTNNQMHEKGIGRIPDAVLHARFVRALPNEYSLVKETLQAMRNRNRGLVRWRCPLPPSSEHASAGHPRCPRSFDVASTGTACARLGVRVSCRPTSVGALLSPRVWERPLCWCWCCCCWCWRFCCWCC